MGIFLSKNASPARVREAENARNNRREILKALSLGQITRRDLYKWGIFTVTGALALKNGLSPFARSAFAQVPTGTPRSPLFGAQKFTQRMPRLALQTPIPLIQSGVGLDAVANFTGNFANELPAKRLSYHTDFTNAGGNTVDDQARPNNPFRNPVNKRGPIERRPPGGGALAPALDRIRPPGRRRPGARPDRRQRPVPAHLPGAKAQQRVDLRHRAVHSRRPDHAGNLAADAHPGAIRPADPHPHLSESSGEPRRQSVGLRPQRDATPFPQCA